jgi:hypothetical protein
MVAVGCLPNGKIVVWAQLILYFVAAGLGFFVTIPIGIVLRNFQGSCILFAQVLDWRPAIIWPWSETSCDYILYLNLAVNIFYATFMGCAMLLVGYKCDRRYARKTGKLSDWQIGYILDALNPVFLIVNILVWALEVCSAAVLTAGIADFCKNALGYLRTAAMSTPSTTTPLPLDALISSTTTQSSCSLVYTTYDDILNDTVTYTVNAPCSTTPLFTTTTMSVGVVSSCVQLQSWDAWWASMRIVRGRDHGLYGANFYSCLVLACVASYLLLMIWFTQMVLNIFMMCRVCTCDIAEEKRKEDRTVLIAQRRSRLATPSVTPGGGAGRHTPLATYGGGAVQQPMGPAQPTQVGVPRQYGQPPPQQQEAIRKEPYPEYSKQMTPPGKVTPPGSDSDWTDRGTASPPPPQQHLLPPPQRRMEPSPKRPVAEGPIVTTSPDSSMASQQPPPTYHQMPALQVRSPPSKLV